MKLMMLFAFVFSFLIAMPLAFAQEAPTAVLVTTQKLVVTSASEDSLCGFAAGDAKKTPMCFPKAATLGQTRGLYDQTNASDIGTCGHDRTSGDWQCWGANTIYDQVDFSILKGAKPADVVSFPTNICRKTDDQFIICANDTQWTSGLYRANDALHPRANAQKFGPFKNIHSFAAGYSGLCVIDDENLKCQYPTYGSPIPPSIIFAKPRLVSISAGQICVVDDSGLRCFAQNSGETLQARPDWVKASMIRANPSGVCAILAGGTLACESSRTTANAFNNSVATPHNLAGVVELETNGGSSCARFANGGLKCWGDLSRSYGIPPTLKSAVSVSVSDRHICATDTSGAAVCWGANTHGQLNQPLPAGSPLHYSVTTGLTCTWNDKGSSCQGTNYGAPILNLPVFTQAVSIALPETIFSTDACAIDRSADGTTKAKCWGEVTELTTPPASLQNPSMIATNGTDACAASSDGGIQCWGTTGFGNAPGKTRNLKKIVMNSKEACAVDDYGLVCWGPGTTDALIPSDTLLMDGAVLDVALSETSGCAVTFDHDVKCWGATPVMAPEFKTPIAIASLGTSAFCATDSDGVKCWGQFEKLPGQPALKKYDSDHDGGDGQP